MTISLTDVDEPPLAPAAPTVTATPIATDSLSVSWSAPSNTGRPAIDSYDLQYREGTTGTWTDGPQNVSGTSTTIAGLAADPAAYQVQVRATNDEGDGPWSPTGRIGGGGGGARNDPPLAVDDAAETVEGTAVFIDVLANDSDPNRDTLTVGRYRRRRTARRWWRRRVRWSTRRSRTFTAPTGSRTSWATDRG